MYLQAFVRMYLAQRRLHELRLRFYAAVAIQRVFRGHCVRSRLQQQRRAAIIIQSYFRGFMARRWYKLCLEQRREEAERLKAEEECKRVKKSELTPQESIDLHSSTSDEGVLTKESSSTEELLFEREGAHSSRGHDSEGSVTSGDFHYLTDDHFL